MLLQALVALVVSRGSGCRDGRSLAAAVLAEEACLDRPEAPRLIVEKGGCGVEETGRLELE